MPFLIFYHFLQYPFFTRHLLRLYKLQISINDIGSQRSLLSRTIYSTHISPCPLFSSSLYLSQPKITSGRALSYARELHPGLSSGYSDQRIDRPCHSWASMSAREIVCVSTKLDGLDLERAPPCLSAAILETAASGIVRTYINLHRADHPSRSKDPFPFGRQTVS